MPPTQSIAPPFSGHTQLSALVRATSSHARCYLCTSFFPAPETSLGRKRDREKSAWTPCTTPGHTRVCPSNGRVHRSLCKQSSVPGCIAAGCPGSHERKKHARLQAHCRLLVLSLQSKGPFPKACHRAKPRRGVELPRNAALLTPRSERQVRIEGQAAPLQLLPTPLMLPCGAARTRGCAPHTPLAETLAQRTVLSRAPRARAKVLGMLGSGSRLSSGAPEPPTTDHHAHTPRTRFCLSRAVGRPTDPPPRQTRTVAPSAAKELKMQMPGRAAC